MTTARLSLLVPKMCLVVMAAVVTALVYRVAWISDDAIITFRYVSNLRSGNGAVFNVGERVQGYTHPLWFLLLAAVSALFGDEVYAAAALGVTLTFAAALVLGSRLTDGARQRGCGLLLAALALTVLGSSDAWRSFQTSGLEGSLSTFLMVLLATAVHAETPRRPSAVVLVGSLLVLCRPDFVLLVAAPLLVTIASAWRERRRLREALLGLLPLLGFVVARVYYGDFLPNTGAAKLGIFTVPQGVRQGLAYAADWIANEPLTCLAAFALLGVGVVRGRRAPERAFSAGLVAYAVFLIVIGGDFMRGRLYVPILVGSCASGGLALARYLDGRWRPPTLAAGFVGIALFAVAASVVAPRQTRELDAGILNERLYFMPSHALTSYRETGRLVSGGQLDFIIPYLDACGKVTIHSATPAALGYYSGPRLTVIDTLGLTDRFIARLPKSYMLGSPPRPGHPYRRLPTDYLARRGDVAVLPGWEDAMRRLDCSLTDRVKALESDTSFIVP